MSKRSARPSRSEVGRKALLACGVVATLLYAAIDVMGGLRYPGYSFTEQVISEQSAIGAPTAAFVARLLPLYDVFALPFVLGVLWEARVQRNRALTISGALLLAFLFVGFVGFGSSPMPQRGTGPVAMGIGHVITGALVVLLQLAAIGVGAFASGRWFRIYSFATLGAVAVAAVPTFMYVGAVAAGGPTPGLGVYERIVVYAPMLWMGATGVMLIAGTKAVGGFSAGRQSHPRELTSGSRRHGIAGPARARGPARASRRRDARE